MLDERTKKRIKRIKRIKRRGLIKTIRGHNAAAQYTNRRQ